MSAARLLIRKGIVNVQGRNRPCIQVQAVVDPTMQALLNDHFLNENLFKRSSYATGLPAGVPMPKPALAPHLFNFIKNDACPEITVKSILAAQLYQAQSIWEVMAFEYIAKRAFDALIDMMGCAAELQTETVYTGEDANLAAFDSDTAAELAAPAMPYTPQASAA